MNNLNGLHLLGKGYPRPCVRVFPSRACTISRVYGSLLASRVLTVRVYYPATGDA